MSLPYTKGSATSKAAAQSMVKPAKNQREQIWRYVMKQGDRGATCQEVERALDICHQSCSTRMMELRQMGRLNHKGETRRTESNRQAEVHIAIPENKWADNRPGWPTPRKLKLMSKEEMETEKWKKRAIIAKARYVELRKKLKGMEEMDV